MQDVFILSEDDYETDMYMLTAEIHFSNQRFTNYKERVKLPSRFKTRRYQKLYRVAAFWALDFLETDKEYFEDLRN
jgi:hypothetical protein